jgi:hypothetical protein
MGLREYNREWYKWVEDYSLIHYNEDYKFCIDLTYRFNVYKHHTAMKYVANLMNRIKSNGYRVGGFMVTEKHLKNDLHNHLLFWSDIPTNEGKELIQKFWNNSYGNVLVREYVRGGGYDIYISKFLNGGSENQFELLDSL